ncbi:TRAP transporter substrate-binding protein [Chloroflexota bacterium]
MRKRKFMAPMMILLATVLVMTSLIAACAQEAPAPAPMEPIELTYSSPSTVTNTQMWTTSVKLWSEAVASAYGPFKINAYHDGSLLSDKEALEGLRAGIADSAFLQTPYFPQLLPAHEVGNNRLFGMNSLSTAMTARIIWTQFPVFREELEKQNVLGLFAIATAPVHIITTKPVVTFADLEGQRIRAAGAGTAAGVEAANSVAVALTFGEVYEAIQRGVVDGGASVLPGIRDAQWSKVAKNLVIMGATGCLSSGIMMGMNLDTWQKLPMELKKIMVEEAQKREEVFAEFYVQDEKDALDEMVNVDGVKVTEFSSDVMEQWQNNMRDMFSEWSEKVEPLGIPGKEISARIKEVAKLSASEKRKLWLEAWEQHSEYLLSK